MEYEEKLRQLVKIRDERLKELIGSCIQLGAEEGVERFLYSPEFEEEAMLYCEEAGWKRPT